MLDTSSAKAERSSIGAAIAAGAVASALQKARRCNMRSSLDLRPCCHAILSLHAPALDGSGLDEAKHHVLDREPDQDDGQQAGEHFGNVELVLALEDVPAEPTLARRYAEHQLGRD